MSANFRNSYGRPGLAQAQLQGPPGGPPPPPAGYLGDPRVMSSGFPFTTRVQPVGAPNFRPAPPPRAHSTGSLREIPPLPLMTPFSPLHPPPPSLAVTPPGVPPLSLYFRPPPHNVAGHFPFPMGNVPFAPLGPNIPPLADPTDVFLGEWLKGVTASCRDRQERVQEDRPMKIPEARGLLSHAMHLISALRVSQAQLVEMDAMGERGGEMWGDVMTQVARWRKELVDVRAVIDRGDNVQRLGRKLAGIRKKRVRMKAGRRRRKREGEEEREKCEKRAEQWIQQKRQERLKEDTERSVQADAGGVLEQVKRKQSDMQHYMKLVTTLKELREHRREAHRKTGDPLIKEDEFFSSETSKLCDILKERISLYEEEEHALRVMIREEVEERMLAESSARENAARATEEEEEGGREGEEEREIATTVDPLKPFRDYYLQAENSVDALINVRRCWDVYILDEGSALPNQLPHMSHPASSLWTEHFSTLHP